MAITIDQFMAALGNQESGGSSSASNKSGSGAYGTYQIMPENWGPWAVEAGLPANAPKTAQNQYIVAKNKIQQYYNKYGNWEDVAAAWYSGSPLGPNQNQKQYYNGDSYPSIREYVDGIMNKAGSYPANSRGPVGDIGMGQPDAFGFGYPGMNPKETWDYYFGPNGKTPDGQTKGNDTSTNPFNMPGLFDDSGTSSDASNRQVDLNEKIFEYNKQKDQWSMDFETADAEWKRLMDERDYWLSVGELDQAKIAENNANYFKQQSLIIQQSMANADREMLKYQTDAEYQYRLQTAKTDAERAKIELARNQDLATIAKMDDQTVRDVSSQQNTISGFNAETNRIGTLGDLAQKNNEFIHNLYSNPRDHFGLFMAQQGITPDWETIAAGGTPARGDPLTYKDPLTQYNPNVTMPGDFNLGSNPFAGQLNNSQNVQMADFGMPSTPPPIGGAPKTMIIPNAPKSDPFNAGLISSELTPGAADFRAGQNGQVPQGGGKAGDLPVSQPIITATAGYNIPTTQPVVIPAQTPSPQGGVTMLPGGAITTQQVDFGQQAPRYAMGTESGYTRAPVMMTGDAAHPNPRAGGAKPEMVFNPTMAPIGVANANQTRNMMSDGQSSRNQPDGINRYMPGQLGNMNQYTPPQQGMPVGNIQPTSFQGGNMQQLFQQFMSMMQQGQQQPQGRNQARQSYPLGLRGWNPGQNYNPGDGSFQFNPQLAIQQAADFGVNPYRGMKYYGAQPTQQQQGFQNQANNLESIYRGAINSGQVPRYAMGTAQASGDPMALPHSSNSYMDGWNTPQRINMLADYGMPIAPSTAKAVSGIGVGLNNTANAFTGRGGGILPSLQSMRNMGTSALGNFQGYAEGPVGISFNDIYDYITGATRNLGAARGSGMIRR